MKTGSTKPEVLKFVDLLRGVFQKAFPATLTGKEIVSRVRKLRPGVYGGKSQIAVNVYVLVQRGEVEMVDGAYRWKKSDVEQGACTFCGEEAPCAVSEQTNTFVRICASCVKWAHKELWRTP